jgi:23S rRNA (uracil1939-C5)-methyltransferase
MSNVILRTTALAVGGEAVARDDEGRVVFVAGALPDEEVRVEVIDERKRFARGSVIEVLRPSPERVEPPCPHVARGCGGCDWQHIAVDAQHEHRRALVVEALVRQGGIDDPSVTSGPAVPPAGVRTTVRGHADLHGHFAYRRRRSHELVDVDSCLIAHPLVQELVADGRFPDAGEVQIRVGARTGERMVLVERNVDQVSVPGDVLVRGRSALVKGQRSWIHEEAAGRRWRISAGSFFQASPEGAEALVASVQAFADRLAPGEGPMADLCSGVGLFAGTVGAGRRSIAVERSSSAVADARVNLADDQVRLVKVALARWRPSPADLVIADPARAGLGADGVRAVTGTGAGACVLVSCDPASLGRDAALLLAAGFEHAGTDVLDLFGYSSHIEAVSGFVRSPEVGTRSE